MDTLHKGDNDDDDDDDDNNNNNNSLRQTAVVDTSHIIRKVLQSEN
jgi:hypothetical protein